MTMEEYRLVCVVNVILKLSSKSDFKVDWLYRNHHFAKSNVHSGFQWPLKVGMKCDFSSAPVISLNIVIMFLHLDR